MNPSPSEPFNAEVIDMTWTDEQIVMLLHGYAPESLLPANVITDLNPFHYLPDNLPDDVWYLLDASINKESRFGLWIEKANRMKIHSSSEVEGWRTTWDYVSSQDNYECTQWLMQEYTTTTAQGCDRQEPAVGKMLCRIFKSDEQGGNQCSGNTTRIVFGTVDWL